MAAGSGQGPVAEFCAGLRQLCRASGRDTETLAAEVMISRSQLYAILNGQVKRPPDWAGLVGPLVNACTGSDARAVAQWRQRHAVLVAVWEELGRHDRAERVPPPASAPAAPRAVCTLPADTAALAGRGNQLEQILEAAASCERSVAICAIHGMPGIGKTALAVQAGHMLAAQFSDRQLFLDLRGHTPGRSPADPADALAVLLAADGVDPRFLPDGPEERAAMWRDRMAGQRVLLILDNAASSAQVLPLLPGSAGCLVLVTSRGYLGDLPAGVAEMPLDVLLPADARAMFASLAPRAAGEPERVAEIADLCGCLPLAILLAARVFTRHESWSMADLTGELRGRLLDVAAENRTVAAAFGLSYQHLTTDRQQFFRYLGLHPGGDLECYGAAALTGLPPDQAAGHLDGLQADHLLSEPVPRRYRMHDLIRQYARSLAASEPAGQRKQATDRLLDYYQQAAEAADTHLTRHPRPAARTSATAPADIPGIHTRARAQAWLTDERANLLACIDYAATAREDDRVVGLTAALGAYLRNNGPYPRAIALHASAVSAAQRLGDRRSEANALWDLGDLRHRSGDYPDAITALERALGISRALGDLLGQANALSALGSVRRLTGDYRDAVAALEPALEIYRQIGSQAGEASTLMFLGEVRRLTGDYPGATAALERSRDISRDSGDQFGEGIALTCLAAVRQMAGNYAAATAALEQARDISRDIGDRPTQAHALLFLGTGMQATGDYPGAISALEEARELYRDIGNRPAEGHALTYQGETRRMAGDYPGAMAALQQAREVYRDHCPRPAWANFLCYLGAVRYSTRDYPAAAAALQEALDIYRDLGDLPGEAEALNHVGALHLARGDSQLALASYQGALKVARAIRSQLEEARALEGIGRYAQIAGQAAMASHSLQKALEIYQNLGAAEASRLAAEVGHQGETAR